MLLATITAVLHLVGRRSGRRVQELETELARTNAKLDRAALMLRSEPQILVSWDRLDAEPTIEAISPSSLIRRCRARARLQLVAQSAQATKIEEATGDC
jgi:hypothetical protein